MARVDRDRRHIRWFGMALGTAALLLVFFIAQRQNHRVITQLEARDTTLQLQVNQLEMDYADLQLKLKRVGSEGYVENFARNEFDYIREGEIVFAFEDPELLEGYTVEEYLILSEELRD